MPRLIVTVAATLMLIAGPMAQAGFAIQVGAFTASGNAEREVKRLRDAGFTDVFVLPLERTTDRLHAVVVGPYSEWAQAGTALTQLEELGWRGFVSEVETAPSSGPLAAPPKPSSQPRVASPVMPAATLTMPSESPPAPSTAAASPPGEWSGYAALELRYFPEGPSYPGQFSHFQGSFALQPEYHRRWDDDRQSFSFIPFLRLDQRDSDRSHFDIRELAWLRAGSDWELRLGVRKVFWGVTESQHLADIINQTDLVENIDGEDKLGQPMVNLALIRDWGTLDLFVLPGFRERTFPGRDGRLRFGIRVDNDQAIYESGAEDKRVDGAVRWSHYIGAWDIGLYHFYGTARDPLFVPGLTPNGEVVLIPRYDIIHQTGMDVQATLGNWLWKLELISRDGQGDRRFTALTGGFEYTYVGVFGSRTDVGVLAEYLYDDRGRDAVTPFQDDVFLGTRIAFNDVHGSELLAGVIVDRDTRSRFYNLEASRRIGNEWILSIEARVFSRMDPEDFMYALRADDYVQLQLARHF